jgi:hypothetical protein
MKMRNVIKTPYLNTMIKAFNYVKEVIDDGGLAYETKSAIWVYDNNRDTVMLIVKSPDNMTNRFIEYHKDNKHYKTHKDRIIKLTGAKPVVTRYEIAS